MVPDGQAFRHRRRVIILMLIALYFVMACLSSYFAFQVRAGFVDGSVSGARLANGVFIAIGAALAVFGVLRYDPGLARFLSRLPTPWLALAVFALSLVVAAWPLAFFPVSADEWGYLFGGKTLLTLRAVADPTGAPEIFGQQYVIERAGVRVTQYLPGWSALLAVPLALGLPGATVTVLLGAISVFVLVSLLRDVGAGPIAIPMAAVTLLSPFFVLNAATVFNHVPATLGTMIALWGAIRADRDARYGLVVGAAASFVASVRLDVAAPLAVCLMARLFVLPRPVRFAALAFLAALPILMMVGAYNATVTGSPLVPPTVWGGNLALADGGISAVEGEWAGVSPIRRIVTQSIWRVVEVSDTFPLALFVAYFPALAFRVLRRRARFYDLFPIVAFVIFAVFPDYGGFQMGPRYWFTAMIVMAIVAAEELARAARSDELARTAAVVLVVSYVPLLLHHLAYWNAIVSDRKRVFDLAATIDQPAVVVIDDFPSVTLPGFNKRNEHRAFDLVRNPPAFPGDVVFARARIGGTDEPTLPALCVRFPERSFYRFDPREATQLRAVFCP
jgi:hypothetical protein